MRFHFLPDRFEIRQIESEVSSELVLKAHNRCRQIANHFNLGKIHLIDLSRLVVDVDDFFATRLHEERRLFNDVMPDVYDQVSAVDCTVQVVAV